MYLKVLTNTLHIKYHLCRYQSVPVLYWTYILRLTLLVWDVVNDQRAVCSSWHVVFYISRTLGMSLVRKSANRGKWQSINNCPFSASHMLWTHCQNFAVLISPHGFTSGCTEATNRLKALLWTASNNLAPNGQGVTVHWANVCIQLAKTSTNRNERRQHNISDFQLK